MLCYVMFYKQVFCFINLIMQYTVPEKIQTHPKEGQRKFLGQNFRSIKYEAKLEFPGGGQEGCRTKNLPWGGVWLFCGTAQ